MQLLQRSIPKIAAQLLFFASGMLPGWGLEGWGLEGWGLEGWGLGLAELQVFISLGWLKADS